MSTSTTRTQGGLRRWVFCIGGVLVAAALATWAYRVAGVDGLRRGSTTVVVEGRYWKAPGTDMAEQGELTILKENGCVGISNVESSFVAVFPTGTRVEGQDKNIRVNGAPLKSTLDFGKRRLTLIEKLSIPWACRGTRAWVLVYPELVERASSGAVDGARQPTQLNGLHHSSASPSRSLMLGQAGRVRPGFTAPP